MCALVWNAGLLFICLFKHDSFYIPLLRYKSAPKSRPLVIYVCDLIINWNFLSQYRWQSWLYSRNSAQLPVYIFVQYSLIWFRVTLLSYVLFCDVTFLIIIIINTITYPFTIFNYKRKKKFVIAEANRPR